MQSTHTEHVETKHPMAKLNHQKRNRPRPSAARRRRAALQRGAEVRSRRELERWRRR